MDLELQAFARKLMIKILPKVEKIVETYKEDPDKGFSTYLDFMKEVKPFLEKIILEGLRDPVEAGLISPRLLRDPVVMGLMIQRRSSEEKESHVVGYLKAILQLVYCGMKGLKGWQFSGTSLHKESLKTQTRNKINVIPSFVKIVRHEIIELDLLQQDKVVRKSTKKHKLRDVTKKQSWLQEEQNFSHLYQPTDDESTDVPFIARLMAYYRVQECKNDSPLIVDPFAERLAGDLTSYANKHRFVVAKGDYPLVRSYYIENNLLTPWCNSKEKSQIVLLGAGMDTRAYRFKPLQINSHTIFEIDFSNVNNYKELLLKDEKPLCNLVRISTDLSSPDWMTHLTEYDFSTDIPSFWVLEGLIYYMEQKFVVSLLEKAAEYSTKDSWIFADVCVPALADLVFGPFTRHFKWGLDIKIVPSFFASSGWDVSCSFADNYDQGRDVGQRGLIFVNGNRSTST